MTYAADLPAAQNADKDAAYRVAMDLIHGTDISVGYAAAQTWLQRSSSLGADEAKAMMGAVYFKGWGVSKNFAAAVATETP